jgi:predicted esterase
MLLLHGTGGDENSMMPIGEELAPDASMLSPRGKVLENGMPRFFRRFAEGVFDVDDLKLRAKELADFVRAAADHYKFDPQKVLAIGYSNGANIAAGLLLLHPRALIGAVLFRPMVPLIPAKPPVLDGTHVYVSAGNNDPLISPDETGRLVKILESYGAKVVLKRARSGHSLSIEEIAQARAWVHRTFPQQ